MPGMIAMPETPIELFLKNIHKVVFAVDRSADHLLAKSLDTTFSQFLLLTAISRCPGLSQQKIATFLNLTPAAISRQIDNLVNAGYIVREEDPESRRAHVVNLTEKGKERHEAMKTVLLRSFKSRIDGIAEKDIEMVNHVLHTILMTFDHERGTSS